MIMRVFVGLIVGFRFYDFGMCFDEDGPADGFAADNVVYASESVPDSLGVFSQFVLLGTLFVPAFLRRKEATN